MTITTLDNADQTRIPLASDRKARSLRPWDWAPYIFLSPFLILFVCFGLFPLLFSLYLAFNAWDPASGLAHMQFVGWDNFQFTLSDPWFRKSLWNTLWLAVVSGLPQHLVAIPLAYFIHTSFKKMRDAVIGFYFVPYITSTVAVALIFTSLFSTDFGLINALIRGLASLPVVGNWFPAQNIDWIYRAEFLKPAISLVVFWRYVGFNTVLYLAALQTIPKDLYEAASMDGAGKWQQFFYVTLPLLRPMMYFGATLSVIGGLQLFDEPFILTWGHGGTDMSGMTTAMYMFRTAFEYNEFGTASAISWLLFLIIGILTWITHKIFSRSGSNDV